MSIQSHIQRKDNPHNVTKEQVGLGNVQNYPLATREEVMALERNDRYIDARNNAWVQEAFDAYLKRVGIVDENGQMV